MEPTEEEIVVTNKKFLVLNEASEIEELLDEAQADLKKRHYECAEQELCELRTHLESLQKFLVSL